MKNCSYIRELIHQELAEGLSSDERQSMESHLRGCQECQDERKDLESTLSSVAEWEEIPIPRNFYLYEEPSSAASRFLSMRRMMPLAASLFLFAIVGILFWSNLQVTYGEGFVAIGFNNNRPSQSKRSADEILSAVGEVLEQRDQAWQQLLQQRLAEVASEREDALAQTLDEAVSAMEVRLSEQITDKNQQLRIDLEGSMASLYESLQWQYQRDLYRVINETNRLALGEVQQSRQTSALASALISLADAHAGYSPESSE